MKLTAVLMAMMVIAGGALAKDFSESLPVVTVCIATYPDPYVMMKAQDEASLILAELPVRIQWNGGRACRAPDVIHIQIEYSTPPDFKPGALGYALPYKGTYIDLFYDRIENMVDSRNLQHVLAHVLAHEITHILEGRPHHSETGVMKARWSRADMEEMKRTRLRFAPEDVEMVRDQMVARAARIQLAAALSGAPMPGSR